MKFAKRKNKKKNSSFSSELVDMLSLKSWFAFLSFFPASFCAVSHKVVDSTNPNLLTAVNQIISEFDFH